MGGDGATTAAPANQPHKHIMYYHNPPNSPTVALTHTTTQPHFTSLLLDALPNTSVVFCFCNEPALSLHNSMYSVIDRSPPHLLHEIILVDDGSDAPHLQAPLEEFIKRLPVTVKIVRQGYRSGLMRARVAGAKVATGDTLTFLDSHISCSVGWLEPLMYRISQGREHVVMPMIDGIDKQWNYKPGGVELIGFNTKLVDHGIPLQKAHKFPGMKKTDPQPSPAMAGGLFSMHREYFFDMGAFDEGMMHWGGENIEIGFRVWQCGGSIELMSCSRIGHVWGGMGSNCGWKGPAPTDKNKWRAIEVWMDKEHQDIMRQFLPYPKEGTGDLSKMVAIREKYKCKSFAWFLETVYPECWMNVLAKAERQGVLKSVDHGTCIDTRAPGGLKMVPCITSEHHSGQPNTQIMYQTGDHELIPNAFHGDIDNWCAYRLRLASFAFAVLYISCISTLPRFTTLRPDAHRGN
eukprot:m.132050 g.132050  ORF g.132050 m.132050 type:complete len:462 (-) comp22426_c0_seq38:1411-2796(-)